MQETRVQFLGRDDALAEGVATHCSTLACRMAGTQEPGGATAHGVAGSRTRRRTHSWDGDRRVPWAACTKLLPRDLASLSDGQL